MPSPRFDRSTSKEANTRRNLRPKAQSPLTREQQAVTLRDKSYRIASLAYPRLVRALRAKGKEAEAAAWTWMRVFGTAADKVLAGSEGQGITITIPSVVLERLSAMTRPVATAKGITVTTGISSNPAMLDAPVDK